LILTNKKTLSDTPFLCRTVLNFSIPPETIPNLIPNASLSVLTAGDKKPYYVVEEILDYTLLANGIEYTREFWESYIAKLNDAPIPGAKSGHTDPWEWWATGESDFFVVGGEISGNSVKLKMYIPPVGQSSSNETFIKAVKTGVIHFSIVTWPEMSVDYDEEGNVISRKAIRSVKGERNDAVERDMGAMEQKVNKNLDKNQDKKNINKDKTEETSMPENTVLTLDEIITNLGNRLTNGTVSVVDLAKRLNIPVATEVHINAVKMVNEIKTIVGENPIAAINELKLNAGRVEQQLYDNEREKLMFKEFGPEKNKVNGVETDNLVRNAAEPLVLKNKQSIDELKAQIETAKKNPVVLSLSKQAADVYSESNLISTEGPGTDKLNNSILGNDQFVKL
jgi:hypothetical protein